MFQEFKAGHRYDQGSTSFCTLFACANAEEYLKGEHRSREELLRLWSEMMGTADTSKGAPALGTIGFAMSKGFFSSREVVYASSVPKKLHRVAKRIREAYANPNETVLLSLRTFNAEENSVLPYHEKGRWKNLLKRPQEHWKERSSHLVHSPGFYGLGRLHALYPGIENSWGEDWADGGIAGLSFNNFHSYVKGVYIVKA